MSKLAFVKPGVSVRLRDGTNAEIYAVKPKQEWCYLGAIKEDGEWVPVAWDKNGKTRNCKIAESDDIVGIWNGGVQ
jgi:hypothetical protein